MFEIPPFNGVGTTKIWFLDVSYVSSGDIDISDLPNSNPGRNYKEAKVFPKLQTSYIPTDWKMECLPVLLKFARVIWNAYIFGQMECLPTPPG